MRKILIGLASLLLLGAGLGVGWYLVGQKQMLGGKAAVSGGTAQIRLSPETVSTEAGSSIPVNVLLSTGSTAISAVTVQLDYDYTGTEPPLAVSSMALNASLLGTGEWSVPIKTYTAADGHARIRIAAINTSMNGYVSGLEVQLATITFAANSGGTINVTFDPSESKVTAKASGSDVLLIPASTGTYTVAAEAGVTPAAEPTVAQVAGPSTTPVPTAVPAAASPTPTTGPVGGGSNGSLPESGAIESTLILIALGVVLTGAGAWMLVKR